MKPKQAILIIAILSIIMGFISITSIAGVGVTEQNNASLITNPASIVTNVSNNYGGSTTAGKPIRVGAVTWHAKNFVGKEVRVVGFVLKKEKGYILFSDEGTGAVTVGDMPVVGSGVDNMLLKGKYILEGKFVYLGLVASNGNKYHLELSQPPIIAN